VPWSRLHCHRRLRAARQARSSVPFSSPFNPPPRPAPRPSSTPVVCALFPAFGLKHRAPHIPSRLLGAYSIRPYFNPIPQSVLRHAVYPTQTQTPSSCPRSKTVRFAVIELQTGMPARLEEPDTLLERACFPQACMTRPSARAFWLPRLDVDPACSDTLVKHSHTR
jgi:hypothetical protein